MKLKLFLHDDYDAVGCTVLAKLMYDEVDVEYHNYNSIELRMKYFIKKKEYLSYDRVIMADISVSDYIAKLIDQERSMKFNLLDHHDSALRLNKYPWAYVSVYCNDDFTKKQYPENCLLPKTCGTLEFYKFLTQKLISTQSKLELLKSEAVMSFVESIRLYDNWYWVTAEPDILEKYLPYEMNTLLYVEGKDWFVQNCVQKLSDYKKLHIFEWELPILKAESLKLQSYVKAKNKSMIKKYIDGHMIGIIFAENYVSELGMQLMNLNPELELIAIVHMPHKISFRTNKPDIDVGKLAEKYGGGGRSMTSACPISKELINTFTEGMFVIEEMA